MADELNILLDRLKVVAENNFHRYSILFAGEQDWCYARAHEAAVLFPSSNCLWISKHKNQTGQMFAASRVQHYLGMEFQAIIFDIYSGFDPDLFAAITGTIKGGGLLILLCPPLDQWQSFNDPEKSRLAIWPYTSTDISGRFLRLTAQAFENDKSVVVVEQNKPIPYKQVDALRNGLQPKDSDHEKTFHQTLFPCRSEDQQRTVQAIMHVVSGHRHRPLVITSDRGRGKSAALGVAAAQLLKQGTKKIVVTAPRQAAVAPVFECAQNLLPGSHYAKGKVSFGDSSVVFVSADELVRRNYSCNLLLVDEAAAIPVSLLEHYLKKYSRIVFSTTVHGYEGTGRGFVLRFHDRLNLCTPGWQMLQLDTPIRWAKHDPLEALVFRALLLDAKPAADEVVCGAGVENCSFEKLDRDTLADDTNSLRQLFALLVLAHYQTQPADLRYLLDAREVHIYVLRHEGNIIAAALLEEEGAFSAELAAKVYENQRRVRGHLLPQSLAAYVGLPDAPLFKYARVMRIAVHPLAQHKGLGGLLLQKMAATLLESEYDLWGASFGAAADLIRFWQKAGFAPVHLGLSRNAASGLPAVLVLKPLSDTGVSLLNRAQQKFARHFPQMLADVYRDLDPAIVKVLIGGSQREILDSICDEDWQDIASFVNSARGYEVNSVPIWKLVCLGLGNKSCSESLTEIELSLLITKVLQKQSWPEVVSVCGFKGHRYALDSLRDAVKKLLNSRVFNESGV